MNKLLQTFIIIVLLIAVVPSVYSQEPNVIDDTAPFWARLFSTFLFTGTQADLNCRSTWECVKDSNGLYRYDCYADSSSANGCLCYRTSDPSKCNANQPGTTSTTPGQCSSPSSTGDRYCSGTTLKVWNAVGCKYDSVACSTGACSNGQCVTSGGTSSGTSQCQPPNAVKSYCSGSGTLTGWDWSNCKYVSTTCTAGPCTTVNSTNAKCTYVPITCSDSDGGVNYLQKGTVVLTHVANYTDYCDSPYVLREYSCTSDGTSMVGNSVSCPNGCSNGACSGTAPTTTVACTTDDYQCSGTKVQKCVEGSLQSTYWSDWLDCGQNQCTTAITGSPVCPSTGPAPSTPGASIGACAKEGEWQLFNLSCCEGLSTGGYVIGACKKLAENETSPPPVLPPSADNTTLSGKSVSLTYKEWQDSTIAQRFKTLCKTNDQCEKYEDLEGTGKEYIVKCNADTRIQTQLQTDVDKICGDSQVQTFFKQNKVQTLIVGGAVGLAVGCGAGATYGSSIGLGFSLITGGISIPVGATIGCVVGALGGTALASTGTQVISNAFLVNCADKSVPKDAGACIATPKGGIAILDQLTAPYTLVGIELPIIAWIIIGFVALVIVLSLLKPK